MQEQLTILFTGYDWQYADWLALACVLGLIALVSIVIHVLMHHVILSQIEQLAHKYADRWHQAIFEHQLFNRCVLVLQGIVVYVQANLWLHHASVAQLFVQTLAYLWILLFGLLVLFSTLDVILRLCQSTSLIRNIPIRGIFQAIKLVAAVITVLLMIAALIGKSPVILFSGLGAMTAITMLVFKEPIMGLVAGIQLSANNMLSIGDWLEMPNYSADGEVTDIGLTTVKVRNWDNTITTVPTSALISTSFKNWRGMSESGGRRIKRSLNLDVSSVRFLDESDLSRMHKARLLGPYLNEKIAEIDRYNAMNQVDLSSLVNGRRLTNLGTFRAYLNEYLKNHPRIHNNMIFMVRQLQPTPDGLPLEIYAFTNTTAWVEYETIQSDIFDHIFAVMPEFDLRVHQTPTGFDMRALRASLSNQAV